VPAAPRAGGRRRRRPARGARPRPAARRRRAPVAREPQTALDIREMSAVPQRVIASNTRIDHDFTSGTSTQIRHTRAHTSCASHGRAADGAAQWTEARSAGACSVFSEGHAQRGEPPPHLAHACCTGAGALHTPARGEPARASSLVGDRKVADRNRPDAGHLAGLLGAVAGDAKSDVSCTRRAATGRRTLRSLCPSSSAAQFERLYRTAMIGRGTRIWTGALQESVPEVMYVAHTAHRARGDRRNALPQHATGSHQRRTSVW
jgi:hypothetical protein